MGSLTIAAALPDPDTIRRTAEEVLQRPEYQVDAPPESGLTFVDLLLRLLDWVLRPLRWLFDAMEGLPDALRILIIIVLVIVLVALIGHITYTLWQVFRGPGRRMSAVVKLPQAVRDPAILEGHAREAVDRHDYIAGVRWLFRACLLRLEVAEKRPFRAGVTNREVLRRHRNSPVFEPLELLVGTIETKWYGFGVCNQEDYEVAQAAYARIVQLAQGRSHADGA